jgi:hypothetical protein
MLIEMSICERMSARDAAYQLQTSRFQLLKYGTQLSNSVRWEMIIQDYELQQESRVF